MRIRALVLAALLVLGVIVAVAQGNAGDRPQLGDLIASSLRAADAQKDSKVHFAVSATIDGTPSAAATQQTRKFLEQPARLSLSGGASKEVVTLDGELRFTGKTFRAGALVGPDETYVNLLGSWYADRTKGLREATSSAQAKTGGKAGRQELEKTLRRVYDHSGEVLDAQVTAGPDIDGATWQAKGHCNPGAVADLARRSGQPVTAADRKGIATFCRIAEVTYVVGADDRLPRELRIAVDLDKQAIAELSAQSGNTSAAEVDALRMTVDMKLTAWGKDVTYTAPANAKPMEEIGPALMGLLFTAMA